MLCALTTQTAGNIVGFTGTFVLGCAALRAIPVARRLHRFSRALTELTELPRVRKMIDRWITLRKPPDEAVVAQAAPDPLTAKADEREAAHLANLLDALKTSLLERNTWTRWDTAAAVIGLLLTLSSDTLPLLAPLCPPTVSISGEAASKR